MSCFPRSLPELVEGYGGSGLPGGHRDIIKRLKSDGFELLSIRGSHHKFRHRTSGRIVMVTHPRKDIPAGTVRSIYVQAGWPKD